MKSPMKATLIAELWNQMVAVMRMEIRKSFFSKRSLWIYLLALAPAFLLFINSFYAARENRRLNDVEGAIRKTLTAQKARMQGLEAARSLDAEFRKTGETLALKKAATAKGFAFALAGPFSEMDMHV